jgi:hypothetical protein
VKLIALSLDDELFLPQSVPLEAAPGRLSSARAMTAPLGKNGPDNFDEALSRRQEEQPVTNSFGAYFVRDQQCAILTWSLGGKAFTVGVA